jgi:hypothetical protein
VLLTTCSLQRQSLTDQLIHEQDTCLIAQYTLKPNAGTGERIISDRPVVCHGVSMDRVTVQIVPKSYGDILQINLDFNITGHANDTVYAARISGERECDNRNTVDTVCSLDRCSGKMFTGFSVVFDETCPLQNNDLRILVGIAKHKS